MTQGYTPKVQKYMQQRQRNNNTTIVRQVGGGALQTLGGQNNTDMAALNMLNNSAIQEHSRAQSQLETYSNLPSY